MHSRYPFPGFVVFLVAGILLGKFVEDRIAEAPIFTICAELLLIGAGVLFYSKRYYRGVSVAVMLLFIVLGYWSVVYKNVSWDTEIEQIQAVQYSHYEGVVTTFPEKRRKSIRIQLALEHLKSGGNWVSIPSKALIYLPISASLVPQPGDRILVKGQLEIPKAPLNPGEFDYSTFLRQRGILWTAFAPEGSYRIMGAQKAGLSPESWGLMASKWADELFRTHIKNDRAYGLVKAMLLGRRDDLHAEQTDNYTASGTVHILSVSGMHVALIFLVLTLALGWIKKLRGGKFIYLVAITALLFFYAIVTGFSPSVQRSAMMCIVLVIAEAFKKVNYPVNTLGLSALLILLVDPMALYDVGFQLSYAAMLGIFLFYKPIESLWMPDTLIWKKLWQVTALSFAAQLATFPLSIYYFHQFPSYFWLVNPFVILFTNALLPTAMFLLAVAPLSIPFLADWMGRLVELLAYLTDLSAGTVKLLPGYLIENLFLDKAEVLILYLIILMIWWVYESRRPHMLKGILMLMSVFVAYGISESAQKYLVSETVFFAIPRHSVVGVKSADTLFVLADKKFETDTTAFQFHVKNYAINAGVLNVVRMDFNEDVSNATVEMKQTSVGPVLNCLDKTIFVGDRAAKVQGIDYMLIYGNRRFGRSDEVSSSAVVLSGDMSRKSRARWVAKPQNANFNVYDLMAYGAFSIR